MQGQTGQFLVGSSKKFIMHKDIKKGANQEIVIPKRPGKERKERVQRDSDLSDLGEERRKIHGPRIVEELRCARWSGPTFYIFMPSSSHPWLWLLVQV